MRLKKQFTRNSAQLIQDGAEASLIFNLSTNATSLSAHVPLKDLQKKQKYAYLSYKLQLIHSKRSCSSKGVNLCPAVTFFQGTFLLKTFHVFCNDKIKCSQDQQSQAITHRFRNSSNWKLSVAGSHSLSRIFFNQASFTYSIITVMPPGTFLVTPMTSHFILYGFIFT